MMCIKLNILFFGATADIIGKRRIEIDLPIDTIASQILDKLISDFPSLSEHRLLYSVNQQYASGNEILADGDEIAIFTAVSGG
ncbi:MAG TPA: MoaD/ThiS family protein [Pyrinomonadaceae bacterium]|mgnify:CR=1 FL=1|nr:MoaD/ThiS family protein [Pyrinomonadaceae bacterium]